MYIHAHDVHWYIEYYWIYDIHRGGIQNSLSGSMMFYALKVLLEMQSWFHN